MQWIRSSIKFFVDQTNRVIVLRMAESHVLNVHVFIWASLLSCVLVSSYSQIVDPVTMVTESLNIDIYLDVERMGYINQSFCPAYHTGYQSKFTYVPEPSNSVQDTPTATIEGSSYGTGLSNSATDEGPSLPDKMTGTVEGDKTLSELFDDLYMLATNEDYGKTTELNTMKENTIDNILAYAYKAADKALAADVTEGSDGDVGEELLNKTQGRYVYPKLTRIDPGKVGNETNIELLRGRFTKRITRSVYPPIFEIPDFLSPEESFYIKQRALETGLHHSGVSGRDITEQYKDGRDRKDVLRLSETSTLLRSDIGEQFHRTIVDRVASVTEQPKDVIERSEDIQVARYEVGGHYHAHLDSTDNVVLPCCFQSPECQKHITTHHTRAYTRCCRTCRYVTVLYYLNDVDEGGETAFPIADTCTKRYEFIRGPCQSVRTQARRTGKRLDWMDLSRNCDKAALRVKPKMGTAIMWYSHFVDERTGYLGHVDEQSYHGGCDLLKGTKWIATSWIHTPPYKDRYQPSIYTDGI